jgi:hypothetical protein
MGIAGNTMESQKRHDDTRRMSYGLRLQITLKHDVGYRRTTLADIV